MTRPRRSSDLMLRIRDFARGRSGAAAIEFAALLPFMLATYIGGVEIGDGVAINRKVAITARSVADLAAQFTSISNSDMSTILSAASVVVAPYPVGPVTVTVSQVTTDANGNSTITWSDTLNGTAHTVGSPVTLPGQLAGAAPGKVTSLIWGEVTYGYTPTLGYVMTGTLSMSKQIFMGPRQSTCVSRPPTYTCP